MASVDPRVAPPGGGAAEEEDSVPGGDAECCKVNGIRGLIGRTGQCGLVSPLFHFPVRHYASPPGISTSTKTATTMHPILRITTLSTLLAKLIMDKGQPTTTVAILIKLMGKLMGKPMAKIMGKLMGIMATVDQEVTNAVPIS